jgi:chromosomal replication initiator protein
VRELEGFLIKLIASSAFTGKDISIEVAQEICGDIISRKNQRVSVLFIQQKVAELFNISPNQLTAHTRKRDVSHPRSIAMYLCKKWTKQSLRTIGLDFGGRDYSTVIHSCKKIETDLESDAELKQNVEKIEDMLRPLV